MFLLFLVGHTHLEAQTGPAVLRLSGSFMQYQDEMQGWAPETWRMVLDRMKELRMDTVIVQMLIRENSDGSTHSFMGPAGSPDATETILNYADTNGFKVFLGLYLPGWNHDMTGSNFLFETGATMASVAQQIWDRYLAGSRHSSFAGWYIPYEPWTADYQPAEVDRLRCFFQGIHNACHFISGDVPLAVSPFISSSRPSPCRVESLYRQILDQGGIDIVLLQDSVGAQQWNRDILQQVAPYFEAFKRACEDTGVRLWANLESFQISGGAFLPCDAARLRKQFDATAPFVEQFVTFDFLHYMNPVAFLSTWSQPRQDQMKQLFADYKANFVSVDYAPFAPPVISASLAGGGLLLSWQGLPGDQFQVHFKTNLADATWAGLAADIITNGNEFAVGDAGLPSQQACFYRVQKLPRLQLPDSMTWIAPGQFLMGTPANDPNVTPAELPQFSVTLTHGYWIGRCEVTQSEFQNVMCTNRSTFTGDLSRPVENISWSDAMDYCARLTQQERQAGRLTEGYVYRLPTEAEWEYAARAGTTNRFGFGDDPAALVKFAWYDSNSDQTTHPVGSLAANPWGLNDMSGNVFEWCWDWIGSAPAGAVTDFRGPTAGPYHGVRGGAWAHPWAYCRLSWRIGFAPMARQPYLGFRVVVAPAGS